MAKPFGSAAVRSADVADEQPGPKSKVTSPGESPGGPHAEPDFATKCTEAPDPNGAKNVSKVEVMSTEAATLMLPQPQVIALKRNHHNTIIILNPFRAVYIGIL